MNVFWRVVMMLVSGQQTFPDLFSICGWQVTTLWANCPLWASQHCRSLAGTFPWSKVDMWPPRGCSVRYGSTNQANSAFNSSGVNNWVVIHVIWRPLNGRPGLHLAVWLQVKVCRRRLSLWPIGCTPALFVTQSAVAAAVCSLWCYIVLYAFANYAKTQPSIPLGSVNE